VGTYLCSHSIKSLTQWGTWSPNRKYSDNTFGCAGSCQLTRCACHKVGVQCTIYCQQRTSECPNKAISAACDSHENGNMNPQVHEREMFSLTLTWIFSQRVAESLAQPLQRLRGPDSPGRSRQATHASHRPKARDTWNVDLLVVLLHNGRAEV
jgi:hypothetical protein